MKWFQIKEKSASKNGLKLCWYIYNLFGKSFVKIIAFFVALITFIGNADLRSYLKKYFSVLYQYTYNKKFKPSLFNTFKNTLNYAYSLTDKMIVFGGKYNSDNIYFADGNDKTMFYDDIKTKKGILLLCNHIGNIEVMRSLLNSNKYVKVPSVSIFMNESHCKIFTDFISNLSKKQDNLKIYSSETVDIDDAIKLESDLNNGGIAFMAGDRISESNPKQVYEVSLLNRTIQLPKGVFKLAKLTSAQVYFVSAVSDKDKYKIFLKKYVNDRKVELIKDEFVKFMQEIILEYPYQFYHFSDYFED